MLTKNSRFASHAGSASARQSSRTNRISEGPDREQAVRAIKARSADSSAAEPRTHRARLLEAAGREADEAHAHEQMLPDSPPPLPRAIPTPPAAVALEQLSQQGQNRWIDRRRVARKASRLRAALEPVDATGALRSPVIYLRDLDEFGAGFISHHDVSAMGLAELLLPAGLVGNRRPLQLRCKVRRCRELPNRWFEGLLEFVEIQPSLSHPRA